MEITAYMKDGCPACAQQELPGEAARVEITQKIGQQENLRVAPTIDVECQNGERKRFEGVTSKDELTSTCNPE